ncbi:MAG: cytochrome C, partial [Vicinamibacterales bacterium]
MRGELSQSACAALVAAATFIAGCLFASDTFAVDRDADAGRLIYLQGVLPSGTTLRGTAAGDVAPEGAQLVCVGCHGRSGMGVGEGQT